MKSKLVFYAFVEILTVDSYLVDWLAFSKVLLELSKDLTVLATILFLVLNILHSGLSLILQLNILHEHVLAIHGIVPLTLLAKREHGAAICTPHLDRIPIEKLGRCWVHYAWWALFSLDFQFSGQALVKPVRFSLPTFPVLKIIWVRAELVTLSKALSHP